MYVGTWVQVPTYIHHTDLRRESEGRESWHELTVPGGHQPDISCSMATISFSTRWMSASFPSSGRGGRYS